jgi:polar amino acid transport system substrate-binding protein
MKSIQAIVAVLLLAPSAFTLAAPAHLRVYTEASLPTSMKEGDRVIGSGTEKVREIMARTGTSYTIELLPWRRAYTFTQQYDDACLFSTTRTPDREHLFQWVGPTDYADWVLLGRADRDYKLETLEDARKLRIGTYNGDAREEYLRARGFQVDSAPHDMVNPRKLMLNRIDLWAASFKRGSAVIVRNGWQSKIVPVLSFNRVEVYLACNRAVPAALIDKMNAAMEAMVRDGTVKRIDDKYEKWPRGGAAVQ